MPDPKPILYKITNNTSDNNQHYTHRLAVNAMTAKQNEYNFCCNGISALLFLSFHLTMWIVFVIILVWRFVAAKPSLLCYLIHDYYQYKLQIKFFAFLSVSFDWLAVYFFFCCTKFLLFHILLIKTINFRLNEI